MQCPCRQCSGTLEPDYPDDEGEDGYVDEGPDTLEERDEDREPDYFDEEPDWD
jgi:hypothetical protein